MTGALLACCRLLLCGLPLLHIGAGAKCTAAQCRAATPRTASLLQVDAWRGQEHVVVSLPDAQSVHDMSPEELLQITQRVVMTYLQPNQTAVSNSTDEYRPNSTGQQLNSTDQTRPNSTEQQDNSTDQTRPNSTEQQDNSTDQTRQNSTEQSGNVSEQPRLNSTEQADNSTDNSTENSTELPRPNSTERAPRPTRVPLLRQINPLFREIEKAVSHLLDNLTARTEIQQARLDKSNRELRACGRMRNESDAPERERQDFNKATHNREDWSLTTRHNSHEWCRWEESRLADDKDKKCDALLQYALGMGQVPPVREPHDFQGTVVEKWRVLFRVATPIFKAAYHEFTELDEVCLNATAIVTEKREACNKLQTVYESAVCTFVSDGGGDGGGLDCLQEHVERYNDTIQEVTADEAMRLAEYTSMRRIMCYIQATSKGENWAEAMHECHTLVVDVGGARVRYPGWPLLPKQLDISKMYPCGRVWASFAYSTLPHNAKENDCVKCPTLPDLDGSAGVYTRWGSTTCQDPSTKIYSGVAAGSGHNQAGNGANLLCLVKDPTEAPASDQANNNNAVLYGVQYYDMYAGVANNYQDAACATCAFSGAMYTMWGSTKCKEGHIELYTGNVMSSYHGHQRSEWACVDKERRTHFKTDPANHESIRWYLAEYDCGSLPCGDGQFDDGMEVACALCGIPDVTEATFTRWGHESCPENAELIYSGLAAGANKGHSGGGYNSICLTTEITAAPASKPGAQNHARLYGTEYENQYAGHKANNHDAACAVCGFGGKTTYQTWGTTQCGKGHHLLYDGNVMGDHHSHYRSEWVCVDGAKRSHSGSSDADEDGAQWYLAEYECGALPCGPYTANKEVSCSVCGVGREAGSVFTRWGHHECPENTKLVYEGIVAGARYNHRGGGAQALCLSRIPIDAPDMDGGDYNDSMLYGTEYGDAYAGAPAHKDWDAGCAVCAYEGSTSYDVWGTTSCPEDHEVLYAGNAMAGHHSHNKFNYACVDDKRQEHAKGDRGDNDGAIWYSAEYECGSIPCQPFDTKKEVACARCGITALDGGIEPRCSEYDSGPTCPKGRCIWMDWTCKVACMSFSSNRSCPHRCNWDEELLYCQEPCGDFESVEECPVHRCYWNKEECRSFGAQEQKNIDPDYPCDDCKWSLLWRYGGGSNDVAVWRPSRSGLCSLGDVITKSYAGYTHDLRASFVSEAYGRIPLDFAWVGAENQAGGVNFWEPVCDDGFTSVGHVVVQKPAPSKDEGDKPPFESVCCIPQSDAQTYKNGEGVEELLWSDGGTGGTDNCQHRRKGLHTFLADTSNCAGRFSPPCTNYSAGPLV